MQSNEDYCCESGRTEHDAECGATLVLRAEGSDADEALDALAALILNKFGER